MKLYKKIVRMRAFIQKCMSVSLLLLIAGNCIAQQFVHPGILHSAEDINRMREKVQAQAQPWFSGWQKLIGNSHAQTGYTPNPVSVVYRGGSNPQTFSNAMNDAAAAYQCALRWKISGDAAYADKAVQILNIWAATCTLLDGSTDWALTAGLQGFAFANAAELMRDYSGWATKDFETFKKWMINVWYSRSTYFLYSRNGTCRTHYWANWGLCNAASVMAIGILCDDEHIYNEGISYIKTGNYNEAINNVVYYLHSPILGQWQESNRDQGHTLLGVGLAADICEVAWKQGDDLYRYSNNRLLAGFEYVARYNLGEEVPNIPYSNCSAPTQQNIGTVGRGAARPTWERIYNHYVNRKGIAVPYSRQFADQIRPEGGGGDYGNNSGGYDLLGFGTLTSSLEPRNSSCASTDITANAQVNGGAMEMNANLTVPAGATVLLSPEATGGTWKWSNGSTTRELLLENVQEGATYRSTFTNACGEVSTQSYCIAVLGDCATTPIAPYMKVNNDPWQMATSVMVDRGSTVMLGPQPARGSWVWSNGVSVREYSIVNIQKDTIITGYYTSPCGATTDTTFYIRIRNPVQQLLDKLREARWWRDSTQTSTTIMAGKYPIAENVLLNDTIVYVQVEYDSITATVPQTDAFTALLERAIQRYKQSVYFETNTLPDGVYLIRIPGTDSSWTKNTTNTPRFNEPADSLSVLFLIEKQSNGRYKVAHAFSAPDGFNNYINENAQFGKNVYDATWNTLNVYFNGVSYAVQRTEKSGNGFWYLSGTSILSQSGSNNAPLPLVFPFDLVPDTHVALRVALLQSILLRDTTSASATGEPGKYPVSTRQAFSDSIEVVLSVYDTITSPATALRFIKMLSAMNQQYRVSMFYKSNELRNGIFKLKPLGADTYWTRNETNSPSFSVAAIDRDQQRWRITKEANGRYMMSCVAAPVAAYKNYINESAQFGTNNYDATWNTMNILYNGSGYAVQRTQRAGNGYWYLSGNKILAVSGSANDPFPYNFPFIFEPAPDSQHITIVRPGVKVVGDSSFLLNATASSGLPLVFSSSDTNIVVIKNGLLELRRKGQVVISVAQAGDGFYLPAAESAVIEVLGKPQYISFDSIPPLLPGDAVVTVPVVSSAGLPVEFVSSDSSIATVLDGEILALKPGVAIIKALQAGNESYAAAVMERVLVVDDPKISLLYMDGDNGNITNNVIRPYFRLQNESTLPAELSLFTVRYWLTPENYTGSINGWVDYTEVGKENVYMRYVEEKNIRAGAFGYIEYSFLPQAGVMAPMTGSGNVQTRIAHADWSVFNEADDYSYVLNNGYVQNEHISVYRNGVLVWGAEPEAATPVMLMKPFTKTQQSGINTISALLELKNEGNQPLPYAQIKVRYWFTKDGTAPLNFWLDYAKLGDSNVTARFSNVQASVNADAFLEFSFSGNLGNCYPLSGTGDIKFRINKQDWSVFDQQNDHSYMSGNAWKENLHVTVYFNDSLIYGSEPSGFQTEWSVSDAVYKVDTEKKSTGKLYPNPARDKFYLLPEWNDVERKVFTLRITDAAGKLVYSRKVEGYTGGAVEVRPGRVLTPGMYWVTVDNENAIALVVE